LLSTIVLGASKDNTLYQSTVGDISNGAGDSLFAGLVGPRGGSAIRRGLLAFDIADNIPAGSTINSVTLTLNMLQSTAGAETVQLRDVLADWGEGTSVGTGRGAPATTNDATWIYRFFNTTATWTNAGGDFATTASASTSVGGVGFYTWGSTPQMVADVQNWLNNPGNNFGWLVLGNETTTSSAKRFASKDNPDSTKQPALTIDYTSPSVASFVVSDFPSSVTAGAGGTVTVTAKDVMGHTVTNYQGTVHFTSSDPQVSAGSGLPADYTFTAADAGVHVFSVTLTTAGTESITVTDTASSSIAGTQSGITVSPAAADHFALALMPSSVTAGVPFAITVTVQDAYGNTVTGYTGTVHFQLTGPVMPSANYTFTAADMGSHTFSNLVLNQTGMYTLTGTDTMDSMLTGTVMFTVM
jgi:plastocyanin